MGRYWLGIDIGGTFTDFTLYDTTTHGVTGLKVPSTPSDFADAVQDGLARLAGEHGVDPRQIDVVVHGTTIAVILRGRRRTRCRPLVRLDEAVAWMADAGGWERARLHARPWSQTL